MYTAVPLNTVAVLQYFATLRFSRVVPLLDRCMINKYVFWVRKKITFRVSTQLTVHILLMQVLDFFQTMSVEILI